MSPSSLLPLFLHSQHLRFPRPAGVLLLFLTVSSAAFAQSAITVRQLALTHSGAYDFFTVNGSPAGDALYPYVARMAEAGGHSYRLDGTFGPLFDPGNPTGAFVAEMQAATADGFLSQWRRDSDTPLAIDNVPGATFADKAYTSLMFSPRNYVGYWFDETNGELLMENGVPEGLNPANDPAGFQLLVDEYVAAINVFAQRAPSASVHIYEFLPPAFAFPHTDDPSRDNTITVDHINEYVTHALGRHQDWLDALAEGIRNHPQLENSVHLVPVPINRVVAGLLLDHPELLAGRDWFDFARDGAPHFGDANGSSDFFEAFLAPVLYGVLFGEAVPNAYGLGQDNIFEDDFALITNYVATALNTGSGGADPGPALSHVDLGFLGTFSHSAWGERVPAFLEDAAAAANPAAGSVGFQVQWGSGFDAHVALLPDRDPTANGGAGRNIAVAAHEAHAAGNEVTLFGIGYLADYIPDEENPHDGGVREAYAEHQFVDLPDGLTGPPSLEALAGTEQINVPFNLARMAVASQADVLWNTPAYPALNELGEPFTRLDPTTYVAEVRERTALGAVGTANAFSLIEASSAAYSGELRLFRAPNDLLIAWIEQAPAWLSGNPARINEVRAVVDPPSEPASLAAAYNESDFLAYPQDSLFVDGGGHFTQLPHLLFAHAMLLTRLAEIDPAFLDEDLSSLIGDGVSPELAGFLHDLTAGVVRDQARLYAEFDEGEPPVIPEITRPDVSGAHEFIVADDGSGVTDSIQAAVNAASAGDTIRVRSGTYPESVRITTSHLTLVAEGAVLVTGFPNGTHGFRIDSDDVELRGFTVRGIHGYAYPGDHAATGFVLNAARPRVIDCVSHSNGNHGFLVLPAASDVLIQGGSAFDNTVAGIGLAGGNRITIRDMTFYSTGEDGGPDGTFQASAILSDNWGDFAASPRLPLEGIRPIEGLTIDNVSVYGHPDYGIRISGYNETLSRFPSGRIATTNLQLTNSHIYDNGSRLSDFVGGLYHLGGVLIQHVDGGLIAGNRIENNYFWGIDAYRCNDMVYRDNRFLNNDRGIDTPGITFEPVNVEINGGLRNRFTHNLVYGGFSGLFLSWIPDSNDGALFGPDSITVENNVMAGHTEGGLSMVVNGNGLSSRTVRNNFIERIDAAHLTYLREDLGMDLEAPQLGNIIGTAPGFADAPDGDFSLLPASPLHDNNWGPATLRSATSNGDYDTWIVEELGTTSPAADRAPTANPDGDNRPNLIEYATGGQAHAHDPGLPLNISTHSPPSAAIELVLRGNDPDLTTRLRYSNDLRTWTTATLSQSGGTWHTDSASVAVDSAASHGNGLWQLTLSLPTSDRSLFARLSVERVP